MDEIKRKRIEVFLWKLQLHLGEKVVIDCDKLSDDVTFYTKDNHQTIEYSYVNFYRFNLWLIKMLGEALKSEGISNIRRKLFRLKISKIRLGCHRFKKPNLFYYTGYYSTSITLFLKINDEKYRYFCLYKLFHKNKNYTNKREMIMTPYSLNIWRIGFFNTKRYFLEYRKAYYSNKGFPRIRMFKKP